MPTCDLNLADVQAIVADLQATAELLVSLISLSMLGVFVLGYLLADPHAPLRLIVTVRRFFQKAAK